MRKYIISVLAIVFALSYASCTGPSGPTGSDGPIGPAGPNIPGLYFIRIFQQGVYSTSYTGQVETSLFDGMSWAFYTDSSNPINIGRNNIGAIYRPIIKFDLSSLPSTKIIVDKAELTIKSNGNSYGGGAAIIKVHKVTNAWTVFQAGWDIRATATGWIAGGGDFDSNTMTTGSLYNLPADSTLTIPLDPLVVVDWMKNPSTNYGMLLKITNEGSTNYAEIYSSGAVTPDNRPMLKVWYYTTE